MNRGTAQQSRAQNEHAEISHREALILEPYRPDALIKLAMLLEKLGRAEEAIRLYEDAIEHAPVLEFYVNLGALWIFAKRPEEAIAPLQKAVELAPGCVPAHVNLAGAHSMLGSNAEALASYGKAVELEPDNPETLKRFAAFLGHVGRTDEAVALYRKLLAARPSADQFVKFGNCLMAAGRTPEAVGAYRQAIALDERDAKAHFGLANACQELTDVSAAQRHFVRATELQPGNPWWRLRAEICGPVVFENAEEIEEFCARVERALEKCEADRPSPPAPLPEGEGSKVPSPAAALPEGEGRNIADGTRSLPATLNDILEAGVFPGLAPSWLGRNPRRLKEKFAAVYQPYFRDVARWSPATRTRVPRRSAAVAAGKPAKAGTPARPHPLPLSRKESGANGGGKGDSPIFANTKIGTVPRVGFLVTRRHEGMFLQSMRGIIEKLDGRRFEPVILCSREIVEALRTGIPRDGLRYAAFSDTFADAVRQIREAACDLIYYWEVGSDAMNYFLPFARLAPVQCTGWGFTVTSGMPAMDWFMSSELVEKAASTEQGAGSKEQGSEEHYTERLWQSRTLFRYQSRLQPRPPAQPADFGLPDNRHLYMCFQNPLKMHPDFDSIMAGILAADHRALIVLMRDRGGQVARLLDQRFSRRIPRASGRIVFLPPQPFDEYCQLICLADAVLDPLHFGASSSCYDIFSFNLPLVTLPTDLMPGRMALGFYRKMQFEELVASSPQDYVSKAVQVATDRDYRRHVRERIAERSDVLFNDLEAVREHERFFQEALTRGR